MAFCVLSFFLGFAVQSKNLQPYFRPIPEQGSLGVPTAELPRRESSTANCRLNVFLGTTDCVSDWVAIFLGG